jgi:hypothetical protein
MLFFALLVIVRPGSINALIAALQVLSEGWKRRALPLCQAMLLRHSMNAIQPAIGHCSMPTMLIVLLVRWTTNILGALRAGPAIGTAPLARSKVL